MTLYFGKIWQFRTLTACRCAFYSRGSKRQRVKRLSGQCPQLSRFQSVALNPDRTEEADKEAADTHLEVNLAKKKKVFSATFIAIGEFAVAARRSEMSLRNVSHCGRRKYSFLFAQITNVGMYDAWCEGQEQRDVAELAARGNKLWTLKVFSVLHQTSRPRIM